MVHDSICHHARASEPNKKMAADCGDAHAPARSSTFATSDGPESATDWNRPGVVSAPITNADEEDDEDQHEGDSHDLSQVPRYVRRLFGHVLDVDPSVGLVELTHFCEAIGTISPAGDRPEVRRPRAGSAQLGQRAAQVAHGLADALLVLDEGEPHVAVTTGAEPHAGRRRDIGLFDQIFGEFE